MRARAGVNARTIRRTGALRIKALLLTLALLVAAPGWRTPLGAGQAPASGRQQQPPTFRVEVDYVPVDVTVTDENGQFVRDLRPEDFEVFEDGKPQQISTFALVNIPLNVPAFTAAAGAPAGTPETVEPDVRSNAGQGEGRVYVIVLDDLHVAALRSARVKEVARQFIEKYLGPNDLAAVIHTSGRTEASQDFTTRRSLLLAAVDKFVGRKLRSSVLERLDEYQRTLDQKTDADIRLRKIIDPLDVQRADQAQRMLKTLANLSDLLAQAQGRRKALVLISEGVDYPLQSGMTQTSSGLSTMTNPYAPDVLRDFQETIRAAARANVNVYAIDPRGLPGTGDELIEVTNFPENPHLGLTPTAFQDELRQAQDSLRSMAEETGGIASVTSNDFSNAFERIVRDNSTYYVLGYRPTDTRRDSRFRKIEVRVKRPGLRVRARSGYSAAPRDGTHTGLLTAEAEPSVVLRTALNASLPLAGLPLRVFAAPFRGAKEHASISVGVEVDAGNFRFEEKSGLYSDKLEVALVAMDAKGNFTSGDRQTVELNLKPETYRAVQAHGLRLLFRVSLPAGRFQLRAAAHEHGSGASGSVFYDLDVPDFRAGTLSMSGLVLTAPSASRIPTARPDPAFEGVLPSPPTGLRTFGSGETLTALFEVYGVNNVNGSLDLVTSVLDDGGQVRIRVEEQVPEQSLKGEAGAFGYAMKLPLTDLTAGRYTLRIEARPRAMPNGAVARQVPFEVAAARATK